MNKHEVAQLRRHYLARMIQRVSEVEGLIAVIKADETEVLESLPHTDQDPEYLMEVRLKDNFTHRKNKTKRDRLREEAKMFALAAEALRP